MNSKNIPYTQTQARLVMYSQVHVVNHYIDFLCVRNILSDPQVIETCSRVYFWATDSCPASDESKFPFYKAMIGPVTLEALEFTCPIKNTDAFGYICT